MIRRRRAPLMWALLSASQSHSVCVLWIWVLTQLSLSLSLCLSFSLFFSLSLFLSRLLSLSLALFLLVIVLVIAEHAYVRTHMYALCYDWWQCGWMQAPAAAAPVAGSWCIALLPRKSRPRPRCRPLTRSRLQKRVNPPRVMPMSVCQGVA